MFDLLIRDVWVLDGGGGLPRHGDVAVAAGRIAASAPHLAGQARRTIAGRGLHLAPGFIDAHSHSDLALLADPRAPSKVHQGVTTEVIGNCGSSCAPLAGAALEEARADAAVLELEVTWRTFAEYLDRLRANGTAVNVVPLVGHNTIRAAVIGMDDRQPAPPELDAMARLVATAMDEGARGLSTGLYYPPGCYAPTAEVVALARVAARHGGLYASHVRSESDGLPAAVREAVAVGRRAALPVEISHLKVSGCRNWGNAETLVEILAQARQEGLAVGADQYPYAAGSTWLAAMLPSWAQAGGGPAIAARMRDAAARARVRAEYDAQRAAWEDRSGVAGWDDILIASCPSQRALQGQTLAAVAAARGQEPLDTAMDLLAETDAQLSCVWFSQSEAVVRRLIQLPYVAVGSDAAAASPEGVLGRHRPHPRAYGTFARVLGEYVREQGVLSLPEAVRKMTSLPAAHFGLRGRGVVESGAWADLVLFDPGTVGDRATYAEPHRFATGIPWVIVNGEVVIEDGAQAGVLPGRIL